MRWGIDVVCKGYVYLKSLFLGIYCKKREACVFVSGKNIIFANVLRQ